MADDRQAAVEQWIAERLGDARVAAGFPTIVYLASARLGPPWPFPVERGAVAHTTEVLGAVARACEYSTALLLDLDGRILVEHGGLPLAWVGFANTATGEVTPVVSTGVARGYLDAVTIRYDDTPLGRGPTGTAVREGRPVVVNSWTAAPEMAPWREPAEASGLRASMAVPFLAGDQEKSALSVYSSSPGFFDDEVVGLLVELSGDLGYALRSIAVAEALAQSEEELRRLNAELERRVEERTRELEVANRELESFAYSVSHDLRAPLRAIDGFARILEEDHSTRLDTEGLRVLGVVRDQSRRMGHLVEDLLSFSRAGRSELRSDRVDMMALARAVAADLVGASGVDLATVRVNDLPPALGDPSLLRQVWANLLGNALKFSARVATPRVSVKGEVQQGAAVYSEVDNGVGFDMAYADRLFDIFQRLHSEAEFPGTGVGLALVQRIVHRHGGRVGGEGAPGEGARFWFSLPPSTEGGT